MFRDDLPVIMAISIAMPASLTASPRVGALLVATLSNDLQSPDGTESLRVTQGILSFGRQQVLYKLDSADFELLGSSQDGRNCVAISDTSSVSEDRERAFIACTFGDKKLRLKEFPNQFRFELKIGPEPIDSLNGNFRPTSREAGSRLRCLQ